MAMPAALVVPSFWTKKAFSTFSVKEPMLRTSVILAGKGHITMSRNQVLAWPLFSLLLLPLLPG